jgi:hypothetical protein
VIVLSNDQRKALIELLWKEAQQNKRIAGIEKLTRAELENLKANSIEPLLVLLDVAVHDQHELANLWWDICEKAAKEKVKAFVAAMGVEASVEQQRRSIQTLN